MTASSADMCFAVRHSPAKAVESDKPSERTDSHPPVSAFAHVAGVAAQTGTKYIMVDSGATTSCASKMVFPGAAVDTSKKKDLWAINGTPIQHEGEQLAQTAIAANTASGEPFWIPATFRMEVTDAMEPVMAFCRILDEADCDMHFSGHPPTKLHASKRRKATPSICLGSVHVSICHTKTDQPT